MRPHSPTVAVPGTARRGISRATIAAMGDPAGVRVDVRDLLAHTRPAYGGRTWTAALPNVMKDATYARVVHDLVADLEAGRPILEPVWVHARRGARLRNGMHRLTAHLLTGRDTIQVTTVAGYDDVEMVELTGTVNQLPGAVIDTALAAEMAEDGDLAVVMRLLSLRAGPVWANSDGACFSGREWNAWYYAPHAHQGDLIAAVTSRAHELGFDLRITKVDLVSSAD